MSTLTKKSILNKMSICQNNINSPAHKTCYSAALKHWITATEKKRGIFLSEQIARMNFYHNFILVLKTLRPKVIIRRRRGSGVNGTGISSKLFFWHINCFDNIINYWQLYLSTIDNYIYFGSFHQLFDWNINCVFQ